MDQLTLNGLKTTLNTMAACNKNIYAIAYYGIIAYYRSSAKETYDIAFYKYVKDIGLEDIGMEDPMLDPLDEDGGAFQLVATLYYLLSKNREAFKRGAIWLTRLSEKQREVVLSWPENYVFSIFDVQVNKKNVFYTDQRTGKNYRLKREDAETLRFGEGELKNKLVAILVPGEDGYLAVPPISYPVDDFTIARMNRNKDKNLYEYNVLKECANYLIQRDDDAIIDGDDWEEFPHFYAAEKNPGESDQDFANRLLKQSRFFSNFKHRDQAEAFLIKVIQTFPQLFHSRANALELLEALRQLFVNEVLHDEDLIMFSNEVEIFWYSLILEHLPEDVKALKPYLFSE